VRVIVDKTSARVSKPGSRYSAATYLINAGIPVWVDTRVSIAHNKVMVIDHATVITGRFTAAAQYHNAENLLVTRDAELARLYGRTGEGVWRCRSLTTQRRPCRYWAGQANRRAEVLPELTRRDLVASNVTLDH
jgi:phosphatidylserine/phosphatidylglycerophosphate/cardiolipin synthase-like enzyme